MLDELSMSEDSVEESGSTEHARVTKTLLSSPPTIARSAKMQLQDHPRKEIILRSNSPWGFHPFQPPNSPKGQVARVFGELPPCMTRGSSLRPLGCLT